MFISFNSNGHKVAAVYSLNGYNCDSIRNVGAVLPKIITEKLKNKYPVYSVFHGKNIRINNETIYQAIIENNNDYRVANLQDEEIEEIKKIKNQFKKEHQMKRIIIIVLSILSVYFSTAQKVGIGTTTPAFKLDVKGGSINTDSLYRIGGSTVLSVKGTENTFTGINSGFSNIGGAYNTANGFETLYSNTNGDFNTAIGHSVLFSNTQGFGNTAIGIYALANNTIGNNNTANGVASLYYNTTGNYNTANGSGSLYYNSTGSYNTANGMSALYYNTTGSENAANGYKSLYSNTTGIDNAAFGFQAMYSNTTGFSNTANGKSALYSNTTGSGNTATGYFSLYSNSTGSYNIAIGHLSLYSNTIGYYNNSIGNSSLYSNSTGSYNTSTGDLSLYNNNTGNFNTSNGASALRSNTSGGENTAVGVFALQNTSTSFGNTAIGYRAGDSYNNGYYNTFLGSDANANDAGYYNSIAIGNTSTVTAPVQVRIGGSFIESIGGYQNWTNISDGRYKKNIKEDVRGLDFIMKLRPVTYNLDVTGISRKLNESRDKGPDKLLAKSILGKEKTVFSGFVAQEVETVAKETGYDFSGVDKPKNENDFYGLRYAEFVVPLVKAMQEQQNLIRDMQKKMETQQQQINQLLLLQKK